MEQKFKVEVVVEQSLLPDLISILSDKKIRIQSITAEEPQPKQKSPKTLQRIESPKFTELELEIINFLSSTDSATSNEVAEHVNRNKASISSVLSKLYLTNHLGRTPLPERNNTYKYFALNKKLT